MIPLEHVIGLSALLFAIGVVGVVTRRNLIVILMSIELMLNAVNLNLIAFSRRLSDLTGQVFSIFVITIAAGEAAIGLALTISFFRQKKTLDVEEAHTMQG
jgi:NADH-quinone oxidoreductase subunit K